jgi:PIN domain nuclease of toxin-antitoxin system
MERGIEMVVLDTSALIYWTLYPARLTDRGRSAISGADEVVISSISIWEIGLKVARGKLEFPISVAEYVGELRKLDRFDIKSVDVVTWLENVALDWDNRDPADRTIVATAIRLECPLITSDHAMRSFYARAVW